MKDVLDNHHKVRQSYVNFYKRSFPVVGIDESDSRSTKKWSDPKQGNSVNVYSEIKDDDNGKLDLYEIEKRHAERSIPHSVPEMWKIVS